MISVWWDDAADGPTNMGADEALAAESLRRGTLLVRVYGWSTTTVSLGAFQRLGDAQSVPEIAGVPLVRRPSGGGAIVHGSDLTYAAAVPKTHPWGATPQALYDALHGAMREAVDHVGIAASLWRGADNGEEEHGTAAGAEPFFCFDRRSPGDLVVLGDDAVASGRGVKIMGSAQRRLDGVVLQHGSLLLRRNPRVAGHACHPGVADLPGAAPLDVGAVRRLAEHWLGLVADGWGVSPVHETGWFVGQPDEILRGAERFRDPRWTGRR
jgi:lipoate-protein ligase A